MYRIAWVCCLFSFSGYETLFHFIFLYKNVAYKKKHLKNQSCMQCPRCEKHGIVMHSPGFYIATSCLSTKNRNKTKIKNYLVLSATDIHSE